MYVEHVKWVPRFDFATIENCKSSEKSLISVQCETKTNHLPKMPNRIGCRLKQQVSKQEKAKLKTF